MYILQNEMDHKHILDNLATSLTRVISGSTVNRNKCNRYCNVSNITILNVNLSLNENINVNLPDLLKIQ